MDKAPTATIAVRHFILTSYDSSKPMNSKKIEDENVRNEHFKQINQTKYDSVWFERLRSLGVCSKRHAL